jgi:Immunoglobulin-like domain of bacterial spore germination
MNVFARHKALTMIGSSVAAVLIVVAAILVATRGTSPVPSGPGSSTGPGQSPPVSPTTMTVQVFFHKGSGTELAAVNRTVAAAADKRSAALGQLLAGPTAAERKLGYFSFFSAKTAGMLRSVRVANSVGLADFGDFRLIIPNASSSAGSQALLDELDATLMQYPGLTSTVYSFNGNVAAFYEWLQRVPPGSPAPVTADKAARDYLRQVAGMRALRTGTTRTIAAGVVEVDLRSESGTGPITTVSLRHEGSAWVPLGARTAIIQLAQPTPWQAVTSPVAVAGQSATFEGQLLVTVTKAAGNSITELGHNGAILGGSMGTGPFAGKVSFTTPAAGTGWLAVTTRSAKTGAIAAATVVPVVFADHAAAPAIGNVRVTSGQPLQGGTLTLPEGTGRVTLAIRTANAGQVLIYLTPTGTNTASLAKLIGAGTTSHGRCVVSWDYPDEPLLAHLSVVATGPGGRTDTYPFNVFHP